MKYLRFDPTGCDFPQPKVPVLPTLSRQSLGRAKTSMFKPLGSEGNVSFFTRGRYALTEAYRLAGVGEGGSLMAPAYHCRTMLDPAIRLGASIAVYPLKADLSPDLTALANCLVDQQNPIRAMLLTHYFGFPQNLQPIVDFCAQHDITLIEDCSHALFVNANSAHSGYLTMGKTGRYGVASPYKFFPSEDGGILWANSPDAPPLIPQRRPSLKQEIKAIVHALQKAQASVSVAAANSGKNLLPAEHVGGHDTVEQTSSTSPYYHPEQEHLQSLASSRWVMRHTNLERLTERRRQHYRQWANAVADLPHCRALFADLPDDCIPYMFPLYIDRPEFHFFSLKKMGLPIWRWDDMAVSNCPTADNYRLKVLHLPCHQELSPKQMTWMIATLQNVMQQPLTGRSS